ncbi:hypothetical protein [Bremerella sp. P1]|uniref:hypothetical protein n=1 Tax=Bremerella sp. P1 TaxID=3026424 RepID=UPI002367F665|nr:hypothetical protein [Bremerella sp. P1]WDI44269.1 hypothetical protein PSR63_10040 [Bremerella sp. P1]
MSETDQDIAQQPPKRAQFPLWFLLFVIPTIAGLGLAIYTNWHRQSQMRSDLIAHQEVLHERMVTLESEIALVQYVDHQIQERADRWKTADAVVDYLKGYHQRDGRSGFQAISVWHELRCFFVQADEQELHRLLKLMKEEFPDCEVQDQFTMLDLVVSIPEFAPAHAAALAGDAHQIADLVPPDGHPRLIEQATRLREVFPRNVSSAEPKETS